MKLILNISIILFLLGCDEHKCEFKDSNFKPHIQCHMNKSKIYTFCHYNARQCIHDWYCPYYYKERLSNKDYFIIKK